MSATSCLRPEEKNKILREAQSGNIVLLKKIKENYPDFHWSSLKYDKRGDTILHCAARLGYVDIIHYLIASFNPSGINCKDNDSKTALHEAAQFSQQEVVKFLIEHGSEINALKRADWTPLMLACTKSCYKTVQLLLDSGALVNYKNKDGWTALHLMAREGSDEIFKLLLAAGADYKMKTKNGRNVLHIAALHDNLNIVKILLDLDFDINSKDSCGNTALHEAVLGRNLEICHFLIKNGADIYCKNIVDFGLLHLASSEGHEDFIKFIVNELRFDINERNINGFSALHCAARKKQKSAYDLLVKLGCNENVTDKFGRTSYDYMLL